MDATPRDAPPPSARLTAALSGERSDRSRDRSHRARGSATDATELEQHGWLRLPSLGKILGEPLADLVSAAAFLRQVLPEIAGDLSAMRGHVGSIDAEMVGMHASVKRIEGQMGHLHDRVGELAERMADVERAVARLEPHVADVNLAVRPLRRAWARVRPVQEPPEGERGDLPEGERGDLPVGDDDGGPDARL